MQFASYSTIIYKYFTYNLKNYLTRLYDKHIKMSYKSSIIDTIYACNAILIMQISIRKRSLYIQDNPL